MNSISFSSCADILRHLDGRGFFHMDLSLHRMVDALRALGLSRPPFLVAQVLGTNGKGSTSTFLASLARAHGHKVGLYTSPHFVLPDERIRINGRPLPGLTSQMRRAAVSIPSNIAEGYGRIYDKERINFLSIALGSASELETQLIISNDLGFMNEADSAGLSSLNNEVILMLSSLIKGLRCGKSPC